MSGEEPAQVRNFLQAVRARTGSEPTPQQVDLFSADDAAIKQAEQAAKRAGAIQREISDQINAVAGAAKRPEKAAALGVNVSDPASVNAKLAGLQALRERARNWAGDSEIRNEALNGYSSPAEVVARLQQGVEEAAARVGEFQGGDYGNIPGLRGPFGTNPTGTQTSTSGRSIPQLAKSFASRGEALQRNREGLARFIEAAGSDAALAAAGVNSVRAREYARESLRQFAEKARSGVIPRTPHLPIYRGDFERNATAYGRASQHAFGAVRSGLRALGLNPEQHLFASGTSRPRLRPGEKSTGDLFQTSDQPFNLIGETGIDYSARQAEAEAAKKKLEAVAKAQDEAQGRLFAQGAAAPRLHSPAAPRALPPPAAAPVVTPPAIKAIDPLRSWWKEKTLGIRKLIAPQTIDDHALKVANIIRDYNGQLANRIARADVALEEWRQSFDQTPVPPGWRFQEGQPLREITPSSTSRSAAGRA